MGIAQWFGRLFGKNKPEPPPKPPTPPEPASNDELIAALLAAHNQERRSRGFDAVVLSEQLNQAAKTHADMMAHLKLLSHRIGNNTLTTRVNATGFKATSLGENIAMGYTTVPRVMQGWMTSSGHRANILRQSYTHVGFGMAVASSGDPYWCAVFARTAGISGGQALQSPLIPELTPDGIKGL